MLMCYLDCQGFYIMTTPSNDWVVNWKIQQKGNQDGEGKKKTQKRGSDIQGYPSGEFVLFKSRHTTQLEVFIWSISAWVIIFFFIRLSISTVFSLSLILVVLFSTGFGLLFPGRPPFTATYLYLIVSSISSCVKSLSLVGPLSWPSCTCQCHFCLVALFHSEFNIYYCLNGMPYLFPLPSRPSDRQLLKRTATFPPPDHSSAPTSPPEGLPCPHATNTGLHADVTRPYPSPVQPKRAPVCDSNELALDRRQFLHRYRWIDR